MMYIFRSLFVLQGCVDDFNNINLFLTATCKLLNKVINIIKFEKHFLNSTTDTQS